MTPTRETIERTIARYLRLPEEADDCTDEVLRALDAAGLVVVPKEADDAMIWGGCAEIAHSHGGECKRCPPLIDTPYGPGTQACRLEAADIYRAMIAAAPDVVE